jgi:methyl-accepting chemotaxis protein
MKWFYNLNISKKLLTGFLTITFISVIISVFGLLQLKKIARQSDYIYDNCLVSIQDLGLIISKFELIAGMTRDGILYANKNGGMDKVGERTAVTKEISELLSDLEGRIETPKEKEMYDDISEARKKTLSSFEKFNNLMAQKKTDEALNLFSTEFMSNIDAQRDAMQKLMKYKMDFAKDLSDSNESDASASTYLVIILTLFGAGLSVGFGLLISRNIKGSVTKVYDMIVEMKKGHLKSRTNLDSHDEIGEMARNLDAFTEQLSQFADAMHAIAGGDISIVVPMYDQQDELAPALNSISETLRELVGETKTLIDGAIAGKLSIRGNADKFKGGYREVIAGINNTLDAVISPLNLAAEYIDRIAKGHIPEKITEKYNGDFNEINLNLNTCIDAIRNVIDEVKLLSDAILNGKLTYRANADAHSGEYKKIIAGVNESIENVVRPLGIVGGYIEKIGNGEVPEKVTDEYKGDYNKIKESVNKCVDGLSGLTEASLVLAKMANNDYTTEVVGDYKGIYAQNAQSINSVIMRVRNTVRILKNIAVGNLSDNDALKKVGRRSENDELMPSMILMIDNIQRVIGDVSLLTDAALDGKLKARADIEKHNGEFQSIVKQVNHLLDALTNPMNTAAEYMNMVSKGITPEPITAEYKGDFNDLKNSINAMIKTILFINSGFARISESVKNGKLDDRGNSSMVEGDWRVIIDNINLIVDSLTNQIRFMGKNINEISKGNIPEPITEEYLGDYNVIKENLNICFASIKALIVDTNSLAQTAVDGKLTARGDVTKHAGDYRKIIEGINETLDAVLIPIQEGVAGLAKMAEGDLTVRITSSHKGDHELIKNSINAVAESLNKALNDVSEAVAATASASNQISSSTEEMAAGASEQTQQTTEIAGGIEEMTRTIFETTKNVSIAAEAANGAGTKAKEGAHVVEDTIEGMNRIAIVVKKSAETVQELGKSSDQIGEIVQVIDDIADQTNLLALNAAIEAARAGEQGRGFAVVADEVRKLAERTTKATKEIAVMIRQIQKDTGAAVSSMEEGTKEVEYGKEQANKAGTSLKEIMESSQKVVDIITQVAAASEQQSSTAEEISKSIEAISSVSQQSAAGTQQIARAAEDLNRLTLNLETLIGQFKIEMINGVNKIENKNRKKINM